MLSFALLTTLGTVSSTGFLQLAQVFSTRVDSGTGAGFFAAAMTLILPAYLVPRALSTVLFPAMAEAVGRGDEERLRSSYVKAVRVLAALMVPAAAAAAVGATPIVRVAYGAGFDAAAPMLAVMVWASLLYVLAVPAVNLLSSSQNSRDFMLPPLASLVGAAVGITWWLLHARSSLDIAWGYLIGPVFQAGVPMVVVALRLRSPGGAAWLRWALVVVAALVATWCGATRLGVVGDVVLACGVLALATVLVWPDLMVVRKAMRRTT